MRKWLPASVIREKEEKAEKKEEQELFEFYPEEEADGEGRDDGDALAAAAENIGDEDALCRRLERIGLDTEMALGFCVGDMSLYEEILEDFATGCPEKKKELEEQLAGENWHEFGIKIHALKSAAKTIGAAALSDMALALEQAAEEENAGRIREGYPGFALAYTQMAEGIQAALNI